MRIIIESLEELKDIIELFTKADIEEIQPKIKEAMNSAYSRDMEAVLQVISCFKGMSTDTVCSETGIERQKAIRICNRLRDQGKVRKEGGLWYIFEEEGDEQG